MSTQQKSTPIGFHLKATFEAHTESITAIAWSPDGRLLASASFDGNVILWESKTNQLFRKLEREAQTPATKGYPRICAWSRDGQHLAVGWSNKTIHLWQTNGTVERVLPGHTGNINTIAWAPNSQWFASGADDGSVIVWDTRTWTPQVVLTEHARSVNCIAWSNNSALLASASDDKLIRVWNSADGQLHTTLKGHSGMVFSLAFAPHQPFLISAGADKVIRVWNIETGRQTRVLEGHTDVVYTVSFSHDGQLFASKSDDNTVRLWHTEGPTLLSVLEETTEQQVWLDGIAFHPSEPVLATLGNHDRVVRIWQLDIPQILLSKLAVAGNELNLSKLFSKLLSFTGATESAPSLPEAALALQPTVHYTTAKIALVGDSGVGKTGLGWRLAHKHFKEHSSTHGQQFWIIDDLGLEREDGTECEAVLWDFAGQPDYRLIHTLFLDDVDLALVLFDPTHQQEPLKGVEYWLKQLKSHAGRCNTILVGARTDRGSLTLLKEEMLAFCQRYGLTHGYVMTSALSGEGIEELTTRIRAGLHWERMTATVTTLTFKRIKEFVLNLKEDVKRHGVLLTPAALRTRLQKTDSQWQFSDAELMTALQHLANHGYVSLLRNSGGDRIILLAPDLLTNLASSLVLEARRNERGLGALEEARVMRGGYDFPELSGLGAKEREILLDAALVLFLEHNLCFRETSSNETFLVFPTLINQKRPAMDEVPTYDDVSYTVMGAVENIYAALVVLLGYTNTFVRTHQWHNQAQYEMGREELCGFRKVDEREGEIELVLYYGKQAQSATQLLFQGLFERFLRGRDIKVTRYAPVVCTICGYRQERGEVTKRVKANKSFMFCGECGGKIGLEKRGEEILLTEEARIALEREQSCALGRTEFAKALVWIKSYLRDHPDASDPPSVFISYAWGVAEHESWVKKLAEDMLNAGIDIILDDWDNSTLGSSVSRFISRIESCDFIVVVGTPLYQDKYINKISKTGSVVAAEVDLIAQRLLGTEQEKNTVIPLLLDGEDRRALPPLMRGRSYGDFRDPNTYFPRLFDLILTLYQINFRDPSVRELREELRTVIQRQNR